MSTCHYQPIFIDMGPKVQSDATKTADLFYHLTLAFLSPCTIFLIFAFKATYFATPESEVL